MRQTNSAGGVVLGPQGRVLVVCQRGDSWSMPKGHINTGETAQQAAVREVAEESGISKLKLVKELGSYQRYKIGKGGKGEDTSELKHIKMFLFTTDQADLRPNDSANLEANWVDKNKVVGLLTRPKDKEFYLSVLPGL